MFEYTAKMLNGALHYSTRVKRGLDIGFSLCAAPTSYFCPSISGVFQVLQGFPEVPGEVWEFRSKSVTGA